MNEERSCACLYLKIPCHVDCSCINQFSSHGCANCCTYGSTGQRENKANIINEKRLFYSKGHELIQALEEYIEFIGKDYENVFMIAYSRGHRSKPEDIQKGKDLRAKIEELKKKL